MDPLLVEWLILLLVTPILITVVVLLYGFVGCGEMLPPDAPTQPSKPPKPGNLRARGVATNLVKLTWQNTVGTNVTFKVERTEEKTGTKQNFDVPGPDKHDDNLNLTEGSTYFYTLRASVAGLDSDPSDQSAATTLPEAPVDVDPRPTDVNRIDLTWTNKTAATLSSVVVQHESPTGVTETKTDKNVAQPRQFVVDEGTEHKFRVFASIKGFQENVAQDDVRSAEMAQRRAKPLAFKATLTEVEPPPTLAGYCIVQRLASALLKNSGTQVWLTVSAPTTGQLKIDRIYLSQPDPAGDPWDSAGAPTKVIDIDVAASEQLSLAPNDPPKRLGPIAFNLNQANDLLISFDFSATAGDCLYAQNMAGATSYYKAADQQAKLADRSPNAADPGGTFGADLGRHYLITEIEVL